MIASLCMAIPPVHGGVRDFTRAVAGRLGTRVEVVEISRLNAHIPGGRDVVLHYSGYGYARRGAPLWLLEELRARRGQFRSLGVFFHELYATGWPWSSAFWLSPAQRLIARRLAELSDYWLASCEAYGEWLCRFGREKPHAVLPVSSNVGEPREYPQARRPAVTVFGSAPLRELTYRSAGPALLSWVRGRGLELHDIGPALRDRALEQAIRAAGAVVHGHMETGPLSALLADMLYGLIAYRGDALGKSGVFAAYSSHAVCPIVLADRPVTLDGLDSGQNYHAGLPSPDFPAERAAAIGRSAWSWYQGHGLERHAAAILDLVQRSAGRADTVP